MTIQVVTCIEDLLGLRKGMNEIEAGHEDLIKEARKLLVEVWKEAKVNKEPRLKTEDEAQVLVNEKIQENYGSKAKVSFTKIEHDTDVYGHRFWVVKGEATVRKSLFRKKSWQFVYYVDANSGKIKDMRGKPRTW